MALKTRTAEPPIGVKAISIFLWVTAALMLLGGVLVAIGGGTFATQLADMFGAAIGGAMIGIGVFMILWALVHVWIGMSLWKLRNWARIVVLVLAGIGVVMNILLLIGGDFTQLIGLLINGAILWYLLRGDVKTLFHAVPNK